MRQELINFMSSIGLQHVFRYYKRGRHTVLSLHRVSNETDYFFEPIRPALFEQLISYISKYYTVTDFAGLATANNSKPLMILSFDDGYYDFIEHALPVLHKYKMPCNHNLVNACLNGDLVIWTQRLNGVFNHFKNNGIGNEQAILDHVNASLIGNDWHKYYLKVFRYLLGVPMVEKAALLNELENKYGIENKYRMINWEEAKSLNDYSVEIGCHTYNHESLSHVTDEALLEKEILDSKRELAQKLNIPIRVIALPNGQSNPDVIDYCRDAGFEFILMADDKISVLNDTGQELKGNTFSRIGLNNESINEMILRTERMHLLLRSLKNKIIR